jgi:hypothetical protein
MVEEIMEKNYVKDVRFLKTPHVEPSYDKKKPHKLSHSVVVQVFFDCDCCTSFTIPKGFTWNGANVVHKDKLLYASMVHDWLCENHADCNNDRYLSTLIFVKLAEKAGCSALECWHLKHYVDNFQKLFGGWK